MLQAILGSHPEIHTCSEPWVALPFVYALRDTGAEYEFNGQWSRNAMMAFFDESGVSAEFYRKSLSCFLMSLYEKALSGSGKRLFLDKTPRYYEIASDLYELFPQAKFIVLYRNPLAVLNSILRTWVKEDVDKLFHFSRDLVAAPTKLIEFSSVHAKNLCLVRYEDFIKHPEDQLERVCSYMGVDYLPSILRYDTNVQWSYGDKNFKQKDAPDKEALDWARNLKGQRNINFLFYYLKDLGEETFEALGYDFGASMDKIKRLNPNNSDLKLWKCLIRTKQVLTTQDQRGELRKRIQSRSLKGLYKSLFS